MPAEAGARPASVGVGCRAVGPGGAERALNWMLPEEEAVAVVYNRRTFAVMLASPADLAEFGIGFSLAEGIVASAAEIGDVTVERLDSGLAVLLEIPSARAAALIGRRRAMEGRSGCGLCGIESLDAVNVPLPSVRAPTLAAESLRRALDDLRRHQPERARNRSVHGAAWADPEGRILLAREDVGRHTAFDKLIGAMACRDLDPAGGFAVLSSRCSLELVQKAARAGIGALVTVSAPTARAAAAAAGAGLALAAAGEAGEIVFF